MEYQLDECLVLREILEVFGFQDSIMFVMVMIYIYICIYIYIFTFILYIYLHVIHGKIIATKPPRSLQNPV